jgi:diacylglycerol kinase family enzyme
MERQGHAQEFMKDYDLSHITGIVIAAGDGTLYEVINGLMSRPDWETAIKTPIGMLPTGSGNGIAASLLYEAEEEYSVRNAAFMIVNGGIQSHDIASLMTPSTHVYIAVVVSWGLVSVIDIESEKFRFLGGDIRFILGALKCIALKRCYQGRFSYLPLDENESGNDEGTAVDPLSTHLLSPIDAPVPDNWTTVEGSFSVFIMGMCSHIAHTAPIFSELVIGSGHMSILYAMDNIYRMELLKTLVKPEIIPSLDTPQYIHTKAFRLEPISPGILSVDGENFEYTPFQVQVHPGLMRLFSRKRQS